MNNQSQKIAYVLVRGGVVLGVGVTAFNPFVDVERLAVDFHGLERPYVVENAGSNSGSRTIVIGDTSTAVVISESTGDRITIN